MADLQKKFDGMKRRKIKPVESSLPGNQPFDSRYGPMKQEVFSGLNVHER